MRGSRLFSFVTTFALPGALLAAPAGSPIKCGAVSGFNSHAEIHLSGTVNDVQLTFVDRVPPTRAVADAMMDCLKVAAAKSKERSILVTAWKHKSGASEDNDDMLDPVPGKIFTYEVKDKSLGLHDFSLKPK